MFSLFRKEVEKLVGKKYASLIEEPPKNIAADLALPCFSISDKPVDKAKELAKKYAYKLGKVSLISNVAAEGPYVNFHIDASKFAPLILSASRKEKYGSAKAGKKEKITVEFAHPNTHKLFHIGHLRNITTGESVSRILEASGVKVVRANYQGDVGLHVAKCLWGVRKEGVKTFSSINEKIKFLGKAYAAGSKAYEESEAAKKEIVDINGKLYEKNSSVMKLWKETRKWSLEYFEKIYRRVRTKFDRLYFESEVAERGLRIARNALKKCILIESDGAIIFDGSPYGMDKRVFVNKLGFPTYEAKELGLAELEFSEFGKLNKCIHITGPEQSSFFKVTFKVEELLNPKKFKGKQFHLTYGWVRLKEGKMSSRMGNIIEGEQLLNELKAIILEKYLKDQKYFARKKEEVAEKTAIAAAKYYFLKFNTASEISFDMEDATSVEGDTGPYLLYTYARAKSILRKSKKKAKVGSSYNEKEAGIVKLISKFPTVVADAARDYKPHYVANYAFALANAFNEYYHETKVIGTAEEEARLAIVAAVAQTLRNALDLLGIGALEEM